MLSAIEQNLSTLLPTKSLLPPQVVSLATSLLAQSKAAAPKLKAQEEIAREYACAHIACERLAHKLALDVAQTNPPCGPRIYNKLHRYLDGVLTAGKVGTAAPITPKGRKSLDVPTSAARQTHSPAVHQARSPATASPSSQINASAVGLRKRKIAQVEQEDVPELAVPEHMIQLSHHLCRTAGLPQAAPHAFTALERVYPQLDISDQADESTQTPNKRARKLTAKAESLLPKNSKICVEPHKLSLVAIAIAHQTLQKMRAVDPADSIGGSEQEVLLSEGLSYIRKNDASTAEKLNAESLEDLSMQVSDLTIAMQARPFWDDWIGNVPTVGDVVEEQDEAPVDDLVDDMLLPSRAKAKQTPLRRKEKHRPADDLDELPGAAGLLPGLGTMFQPAFDWLSDERQEEYARWERGVLAKLSVIETNA